MQRCRLNDRKRLMCACKLLTRVTRNPLRMRLASLESTWRAPTTLKNFRLCAGPDLPTRHVPEAHRPVVDQERGLGCYGAILERRVDFWFVSLFFALKMANIVPKSKPLQIRARSIPKQPVYVPNGIGTLARARSCKTFKGVFFATSQSCDRRQRCSLACRISEYGRARLEARIPDSGENGLYSELGGMFLVKVCIGQVEAVLGANRGTADRIYIEVNCTQS